MVTSGGEVGAQIFLGTHILDSSERETIMKLKKHRSATVTQRNHHFVIFSVKNLTEADFLTHKWTVLHDPMRHGYQILRLELGGVFRTFSALFTL